MFFLRIFEILWFIFFIEYYLYIRIKFKEFDKEVYIVIEDCDKIELVFLVNNENLGDIKLIFKKIKILKYLGSLSII